jgi:hypothetical protein
MYPFSFQERYGREMALAFRAACRREFGRYGLSGLINLWFKIFIDLASSALQEHLVEVGVLTQRQRFIRVAGTIGALGGVLAIILGVGFLGGVGEVLLWLLLGLLLLSGNVRTDAQSPAAA